MHPPLELPKLAVDPASLCSFDLELQCAPGVPQFRGVRVLREFCSEEESRQWLCAIDAGVFVPAQSGKAKQHFGAKVNFKRRRLSSDGFQGLPGYVHDVEARVARYVASGAANGDLDPALVAAFGAFEATDAFVLRYEERRGSNLDLHIDDPWAYGEGIVGVSLESDSVLTFVPGARGGGNRPLRGIRVPLPARSAVLLFGDARYAWEHAILSEDVRGRRTSLTLRTLAPTLRASEDGRRIAAIARRTL